jgi:Leucine-rich repeat (LRR) protein
LENILIGSFSSQLSEDYNMDEYNNYDDYLVLYNGNAEVVGNFRALNFYKASDINIKEDVSLLSERMYTRKATKLLVMRYVGFDCRDTMLRIDGVDYKFKKGINRSINRRFIGYIAQQVESVVPEAVQIIDGILHVDYESLIPFLSESIKQNYNDIKHIQSDNQKIHLVLDAIYNSYIENNMHSANNSAEQTRKQTTPRPWSPTFKILSIVVSTILTLGVIAFVMVYTLNNTVYPANVTPTLHPRSQRDILEAFYHATNGKSWKRASNWLTNLSICEWQGVHCHGELEDVIELDLSGNNLTGTIPDVIAELPFLTTLAVMQNELTGIIPESIFRLPNLQALFLSSNNLNGTISPAVSCATQLEQISLYGNLISGELPPELGKLPRLRRLEMKRNRLQGSFSLLPSPSIQKIDLSSNFLSGQLPDLSVFTALTALDLSKNRLRGSFPLLPSSIQEINLSTNGLSGQLPDLSDHTALTILELSNNGFEGSISFSSPTIQEIDLSFNSLYGQLPDLSGFTALTALDISNNGFEGSFSLLPSVSIQEIDLSSNLLSGQLPDLSGFTALKVLHLSTNRLQGSLPLLPSVIQEIDLSSNLLSGQLPDLSGYTVLKVLDVSNNGFAGSFSLLPSLPLQKIDLSTNSLSGQLPDLSGFTALTALDLSKNFFEGTLPTLPQSLLVASFSENKFNGTLETFKLLREDKIAQLLVNGNYFAGDVSYVTDLHSLEQLDVSFNQLSQLSHTKQRLNVYVKCDATGNAFACPLPDWFMQLCKVNCTDGLHK